MVTTDVGQDACVDPRRGYALPGEACSDGALIVGYGEKRKCSIYHLVWSQQTYARWEPLDYCSDKPLPGART